MIDATKIKKHSALFIPSGVGVVMYTFFSGLIIILNQFEAIKQYLQLPSDFQFVRIVLAWLDDLLASSIGQGRTETFVVGLFWAFVGLGVYMLLRGIARFITELGEGLDERGYVWPRGTDRNVRLVEVTERIVFRVAAFIGFVIVVFGPLSKVVGRPVEIGPDGPLRFVIWFMAIWLTMHICVILVRLMVLRPRLFD